MRREFLYVDIILGLFLFCFCFVFVSLIPHPAEYGAEEFVLDAVPTLGLVRIGLEMGEVSLAEWSPRLRPGSILLNVQTVWQSGTSGERSGCGAQATPSPLSRELNVSCLIGGVSGRVRSPCGV